MSANVIVFVWMLTAKNARLKQAKEEADKEIAAFRAHMEAEFQKKVAQVNKNILQLSHVIHY